MRNIKYTDGEKLKIIRHNLLLEQYVMAVKLGINPTLLSKYERGHRVVPTKIMDKAHRMLDDAGHRVEL
jgi:DNA-binding transcriptional regulator YiaG